MALGCWGRRVLGVYVCRVSLKPLSTWHPCAIGPPLSPPKCGPPLAKDGLGCCPKPPWASGGPGEDTVGVPSGAALDAFSPACVKHVEGGVVSGPAADAAVARRLPAEVLLCCFRAVLLPLLPLRRLRALLSLCLPGFWCVLWFCFLPLCSALLLLLLPVAATTVAFVFLGGLPCCVCWSAR